MRDWLIGAALLTFASSAIAQTAAASWAQPAPAEKMICKRQTETGSLVKTRRVCHTAAQWDRIGEEMRTSGRDMIQDHRGGSTCQASGGGC